MSTQAFVSTKSSSQTRRRVIRAAWPTAHEGQASLTCGHADAPASRVGVTVYPDGSTICRYCTSACGRS